jgi:hypothetical protein
VKDLVRPEKSLRKKLCFSAPKENPNYHRSETSVIFLEKDSLYDTVQIKDDFEFDKEIKLWIENNKIETLEKQDIKSLYEDLTKKIYLTSKNSAISNVKLDLKVLLNYSNIKEEILSFSRSDRKRILKRLESLIFKYEIIFNIFKDTKVRKIILSDSLKIIYFDKTLIEKKYSPFLNMNELLIIKNIIFKRYSDLKLKGYCVLENQNNSLLIQKTSESEDNNIFVFKKLSNKSTIFLDLMKDKVVSVDAGKTLMSHISKSGNGLIISGQNSSGKSKVLAALSSSLINSRFTAFSGNHVEFKFVLKDFYKVPTKNVLMKYNSQEMESLCDNMFKSQVSLYLADDCSVSEFALAWLLNTKFNISSIITFSSSNILNTLLHHTNNTINLLGYTKEKDFFLWNMTKLFPVILNLKDGKESSFIKT